MGANDRTQSGWWCIPDLAHHRGRLASSQSARTLSRWGAYFVQAYCHCRAGITTGQQRACENLPCTGAQDESGGQPKPQSGIGQRTEEVRTDAAIVALIVAASVAAYKAMGRPCACPNDEDEVRRAMRLQYGRALADKPLCFPTDVTAAMIATYCATKVIPGLR